MTGKDGHEEKMSCLVRVPTPGPPASSQSLNQVRYPCPLAVSQWDPNYGVAEAPTSYLRLNKVCGLPLRIAYDICKLIHDLNVTVSIPMCLKTGYKDYISQTQIVYFSC